jgi:NADH-quinone oxidoreductase subunit A
MASYLPILVFTMVAVLFLAATLLAARFLRHAGSARLNREPYECGNEAETFALDHRFSVRYYLIAVLFVIFDVETVFLFPWAILFDQLAWFGFLEMMVFLIILVTGYVYIWNRGALRWV